MMRRATLAWGVVALGGLIGHCSAGTDRLSPPPGPPPTGGLGLQPTGGLGLQPTGGLGLQPTGGLQRSGGTRSTGGALSTGGSGGMGQAGGRMSVGYLDLAVAPTEAMTADNAATVSPPPPVGWAYHDVPGAICRDGSPVGIYLRDTGSDKLVIYFEGGGACTTKGFCHFNPASVDQVLSGTGESVLGTALATLPGRQQPGVYEGGQLLGIFDEAQPANPFAGWNMVYIPYCTGDVHFGTNDAAIVPNVPTPQHMVGHKNTKKFMGRIAATFEGRLSRAIVTGSSAGSFGAALNFSMIADTLRGVQVDAILDAGLPFLDAQWPACMQRSWRELFGLDAALPADCQECFQADGGGMLRLADFLIAKHPSSSIAAISGLHDEVIRLFFTPGENNCALIESADPFELTLGQVAGAQLYSADKYAKGLQGVRDKYQDSGRLASYLIGGTQATLHQHIFRNRFYEATAGGPETMAEFVAAFLDGQMKQLGP